MHFRAGVTTTTTTTVARSVVTTTTTLPRLGVSGTGFWHFDLTTAATVLVALFTGGALLIAGLAYNHGRIGAGDRKPVKVLKLPEHLRGSFNSTVWENPDYARSGIRVAWVNLYNRSVAHQPIFLDPERTRIHGSGARLLHPRSDQSAIDVLAKDRGRLSLVFFGTDWPKSTELSERNKYRRSRQKCWLRFVGRTVNGKQVKAWRRVHVYDRPAGPTEFGEIAVGGLCIGEPNNIWRVEITLGTSRPNEYNLFFDDGERLRSSAIGGASQPTRPTTFSVGTVADGGDFFRMREDGTEHEPVSIADGLAVAIEVRKGPNGRTIGRAQFTFQLVDEQPRFNLQDSADLST